MFVGVNHQEQVKTFSHLRECLSFLRSEMLFEQKKDQEVSPFPKFQVEWPDLFFRELVYLHLVGGFPLYIEGFSADEVRTFLEKLQTCYFSIHQFGKKEGSLSFPFPKLHIFSPTDGARSGIGRKSKMKQLSAFEDGHILALPRLDRSAGLLPVILDQSIWLSGSMEENLGKLRSQWVGFGGKCYCENPNPCRCRAQERRDWQRNSQTIQWYFPLQWRGERSSRGIMNDEVAIRAFLLVMERQKRRNYFLMESEAMEAKEWSFSAKQWLRFLSGKELGTTNLPKVALTCSDFRLAHKVEEEDVLQALSYTSRFDSSGFPSGIKRSKGSAPDKNSTAIP